VCSKLDSDLLNACLRLLRLFHLPEQHRVLGPLVIREIIYRRAGHRMRHLATIGGHAHRMVRAVRKLREDFAKPLRIEEVAREIAMSVSGFHAHFKAVTPMSPLQFQKELRLQEPRSRRRFRRPLPSRSRPAHANSFHLLALLAILG
jgi:transcriptional regulator GlxA family with amidase domain